MEEFKARFMYYIKKSPASSVIILINTIMLIVTIVTGGFNLYNFYALGGLLGYAVEAGEYFRLITVIFLHGSIFHFLMNNYALLILGGRLESRIGSLRYVLLYILSGLISSIIIVIFDPDTLTIGASGALFGILGFLLYIALFEKGYTTNFERSALYQMLIINLLITFAASDIISIPGHLGGLLGGFILGWPLFLIKRKPKYFING